MPDINKPDHNSGVPSTGGTSAKAVEDEVVDESAGDELRKAIEAQNELEKANSKTVELVKGGKDAVEREIPEEGQNKMPYAGTDPEFRRANPEDL